MHNKAVSYTGTSGHEFGHILGLDDAYEEHGRTGTTTQDNVQNSIMMASSNHANANDIEMMLMVWTIGAFQSYETYTHTLTGVNYNQSDAIRQILSR